MDTDHERWAASFELLRESPHGATCLRPIVTLAAQKEMAWQQTDSEAGMTVQRPNANDWPHSEERTA
jgi:hypothetical protein